MKGISRVLLKLLRYLHGIIISTSFVEFLFVWPFIFSLTLNESVIALATVKSTVALSLFIAGWSLQFYHKIPDVFE